MFEYAYVILYSQQDVTEILQHIFEDISKDSPVAAFPISVSSITIKTCNSCLLSDQSETCTMHLEFSVHIAIGSVFLVWLKVSIA